MLPITPAQLEALQAAIRRLGRMVASLGRGAARLGRQLRAISRGPAFGSSKLRWMGPPSPCSLAASRRRLPGPVLRTREEQLALWERYQAEGPPPGAIGSAHSYPRSRLPR